MPERLSGRCKLESEDTGQLALVFYLRGGVGP